MDTFEAIAKRFSYRGNFTNQKISRDDLQKIVQAGIDAPTGCNAQSVSFVAVDEPAIIKAIAEMNPERSKPVCLTAQAMVVCIVDKAPVYGEMTFFVEDCAAATQNILLAITALGYASVWLDGILRNGIGNQIGEILGVPKGKEVRILLPIGVPESSGKPNTKKPFDQRAWFNKYGG
ncbi:MAG: nitroreductase family protein [Planctomycetaceae bacterium]|jgi:nitroreductase|nr:nitroreductase family protein [Planctomycetaceae bacterium]